MFDKKNETYMIQVLTDETPKQHTTVYGLENVNKIITDTDIQMRALGYRRVRFTKTRIDKKHITSIILRYSRIY